MFFRLGVLNVRRQLTRSLLVVLTLALAAISLTYSLAMQEIPPLRVAPFLSRFTGGHILVMPFSWAGQETADVTGDKQFRSARLQASGTSWLEWFYPELYSEGFWFPAGETLSEFIAPDMLSSLQAFPGVGAAVPLPMLQAVIRSNVGSIDRPIRITPLTEGVIELISLQQLEQPSTGVFINKNAKALREMPAYDQPPNQEVSFLVPLVGEGGTMDYGNAIGFRSPFRSYVQMPTREVYWMDPLGNVASEVGHFTGDVVWIGEESWQQLTALIGGGESIPVTNLVLRVDDLQILEDTVAALTEAYPHFTFLSLGQVEARLFEKGSMELFKAAPKNVVSKVEQSRLVMPTSFSRIFSYLLVLIAAILLGGHMLTGAAARNQEIGTLRALGARRRDIMTLGISETVTLTLIGVTIGFFPIRVLGIIMQLRGGQHFLQVMLGTLLEYGEILGLSLVAALAFSLFPVWRLSTVAPMEVLRNE